MTMLRPDIQRLAHYSNEFFASMQIKIAPAVVEQGTLVTLKIFQAEDVLNAFLIYGGMN